MAGNYTNNNYLQAPVFSQALSPQERHQGGISGSVFSDPRLNVSGDPWTPPIMTYGINQTPQQGLSYNHVSMPYTAPMSSPAVMTSLSSVSTMSVGLGVTAPGSFTFTSPTRLSYISSSHSQTYPYGQISLASQSSRLTFAPGLGVSWQHTVPVQMPWTESSSTAVPPNFVGSVAYTSLETPGIRPCPSLEPVPSCSSPIRRPKRPALDTECETPSKVYITEEKMTASMQELSISNPTPSPDETMLPVEPSSPDSHTALTSTTQSAIERSWQKFRELEDMLSDEQTETEMSDGKKTGFKVHMSSSVANSLLTSNPILPRTVLEKMNKPCLQVVLWKPPADKLREIVSENIHKNRHKHSPGKQKSSTNSSQAGQTRSEGKTIVRLPTPIPSAGDVPVINRQLSDMTPLCSMECEDRDSAMEL